MARKNQKNPLTGFISIGLIAIGIFIYNNIETILIIIYTIVGILALVIITILIYRLIINSKSKKLYKQSHYYKETNIPFSKSLKERGVKFEIDTYNLIRENIGSIYPMLTDVLLPQADSLNKDSQIDLILFHSTGIYVIEMKNYSGPLVGSITDERWIPYIKNKKINKKNPDQFVPNWALYDHAHKIWKPINPIKQNDVHINTLNYLQKEDYKNIVLLSDSMFVNQTNNIRTIPNIMSVIEFLNLLESSPKIYELEYLNNSYLKIKSFDKQASPDAKKLHIARIKSKRNY